MVQPVVTGNGLSLPLIAGTLVTRLPIWASASSSMQWVPNLSQQLSGQQSPGSPSSSSPGGFARREEPPQGQPSPAPRPAVSGYWRCPAAGGDWASLGLLSLPEFISGTALGCPARRVSLKGPIPGTAKLKIRMKIKMLQPFPRTSRRGPRILLKEQHGRGAVGSGSRSGI